MKNCFGFTGICLGCLAAALFSAAAQPASPGKAATPVKKPDNQAKMAAGAISNSAEPDIPLSKFVMPVDQKAGKDPFFPNSIHPYTFKQTTNKAVVTEIT